MVLSVPRILLGAGSHSGRIIFGGIGRHPGPLVSGSGVGQRCHRQVGFHLALVLDDHAAGIGGVADDGEVEAPFLEDCLRLLLPPGLEDHEHALLRLGEHHLVGGHAGFALRHAVEIELDTDAALVRHLRGGGGQPCRAHVLDGDDGIACHQFQARLDQQLLGERIAHLHGRALLGGFVVELGRGHGGAVDAVAPGLGADVDDRQADALGGRVENLVGPCQADAHRVDEDVAVVAGVEVGLAPNRRHARAVAVPADARHDACQEMPRLGMSGIAEAKGVEVGDGPGAHGEHVAHDAADAGCRALVGLDEGGMVVALHLEDDGVTIADVDDAGVLARPLDHLRALGRQLAEPHARGFVGAVLAPHHRENAELGQRGCAAQNAEQPLIFVGREPVLGDHIRRNGGVSSDVHAADLARVFALVLRAYIGRASKSPMSPVTRAQAASPTRPARLRRAASPPPAGTPRPADARWSPDRWNGRRRS